VISPDEFTGRPVGDYPDLRASVDGPVLKRLVKTGLYLAIGLACAVLGAAIYAQRKCYAESEGDASVPYRSKNLWYYQLRIA